jgi:putative hydroxymethylpyrimidine transport system substrate-binding protein
MPARLELSRRAALRAAGVIFVALCAAGCGEVHARLTPGTPRPVTVAIDGPPGALFAPLYEAAANGDFRAGALAVTIAPAPQGDSLAALEAGRATVAVASEPALLAARDEGARLVAIGALVSEPLDAIVSLARRPVASAASLAGAVIATPGTPLAQAQLATVLATAHLAPGSVRAVAPAPAGLPATLTERRHAPRAVLGGPWPLAVVTLARGHHPTTVLRLPQAGVPAYSDLVLVVRIGEARADGPLLRAFLQSLSRGAQAVARNPAAAAATLATIYPRVGSAVELAALTALAPIVASASAAEPFGYQDPRRWRAFGVWMRAHGLLRTAADTAAAITDEFLPGQGEPTVSTS